MAFLVLSGTASPGVWVLRKDTGATLKEFGGAGPVKGCATDPLGNIYHSYNGYSLTKRLYSGTVVWTTFVNLKPQGIAVNSSYKVAVGGDESAYLRCLHPDTGVQLWAVTHGTAPIYESAAGPDKHFYLAAPSGGSNYNVRKVNESNGNFILNISGGFANTVDVDAANYIYLCTGQWFGQSNQSGQTVWSTTYGVNIASLCVYKSNDILYLGGAKIFRVNASNGQKQWERSYTATRVSADRNTNVYFSSSSGATYTATCLNSSGTLVWSRTIPECDGTSVRVSPGPYGAFGTFNVVLAVGNSEHALTSQEPEIKQQSEITVSDSEHAVGSTECTIQATSIGPDSSAHVVSSSQLSAAFTDGFAYAGFGSSVRKLRTNDCAVMWTSAHAGTVRAVACTVYQVIAGSDGAPGVVRVFSTSDGQTLWSKSVPVGITGVGACYGLMAATSSNGYVNVWSNSGTQVWFADCATWAGGARFNRESQLHVVLSHFVRQYTADGNIRWTRNYGNTTADVEIFKDGRVFVTGAGLLPGYNYGLRVYSKDGALLFTVHIDWDELRNISVDKDSYCRVGHHNGYWVVAKYSITTGSSWEISPTGAALHDVATQSDSAQSTVAVGDRYNNQTIWIIDYTTGGVLRVHDTLSPARAVDTHPGRPGALAEHVWSEHASHAHVAEEAQAVPTTTVEIDSARSSTSSWVPEIEIVVPGMDVNHASHGQIATVAQVPFDVWVDSCGHSHSAHANKAYPADMVTIDDPFHGHNCGGCLQVTMSVTIAQTRHTTSSTKPTASYVIFAGDCRHNHHASGTWIFDQVEVEDSTHEHEATAPDYEEIFVTKDTLHSHLASVVVVEKNEAEAAHTRHQHTVDSAHISINIAGNGALHDHSADVPAVALTVWSQGSAHTCESTGPTIVILIALFDGIHQQTADETFALAEGWYGIYSARHGHESTGAEIVPDIPPAGCAHDHSSGVVWIVPDIPPADARHDVVSAVVRVGGDHLVDDTWHAHHTTEPDIIILVLAASSGHGHHAGHVIIIGIVLVDSTTLLHQATGPIADISAIPAITVIDTEQITVYADEEVYSVSDMIIPRGDSKILAITARRADGAPFDLTTARIRWVLLRRPNEEHYLVIKDNFEHGGITVTDPQNGKFEVHLTSDDLDLPPRPYYHEAEIADNLGYTTVMLGKIHILKSVEAIARA